MTRSSAVQTAACAETLARKITAPPDASTATQGMPVRAFEAWRDRKELIEEKRGACGAL